MRSSLVPNNEGPRTSRRKRVGARVSTVGASFLTIIALILSATIGPSNAAKKKLTYHQMRSAIFSAPREKLQKIGSHIIVGYDVAHQLMPFLERGAIGGIYITKRNSRRRSKAQLKKEIARFQQLASKNTPRALWITADQEGGLVSRLSPPLPRQRSLRHIVFSTDSREAREKAVREFAQINGKALADIGVNINFAPVVDLSPVRSMKRDRYTHLKHRAISRDPGIVTLAAATYCEELGRHDVLCTLKHFPGLSRVRSDTHIADAKLNSIRDDIEGQDWVPFREVIEDVPAAMMVGHPRAMALDPDNPASTSKKVIGDLVREQWGFDGIIITDDMDMGAISKRRGGMATAAIDALNAGSDLVLFTFDPSRIVPVYYALLEAYDNGTLDKAKLEASAKRLDKVEKLLNLRRHRFVEVKDQDAAVTPRAK